MDTHVRVLGVLNIALGVVGLIIAALMMIGRGGAAGIISASAEPEEAALAVPILSIVGGLVVAVVFAFSLPSVVTGIGCSTSNPGRVSSVSCCPRLPSSASRGSPCSASTGCGCSSTKTPSDCSLAAPRHSVKVMAIDPTAIGPAGDSSPISSFGVYEIRALLGAGGMGQVYRAFDSRLGREIALKVIRRSAVDDESALDRLLREATLASALNHPNIVTIYETGVVGADRYIAMELIEGARHCGIWRRRDCRCRGSWGSRGRSRRPWRSRTRSKSSIATSSPTTSWSGPTATSSCSTSGSRARNRIATGAGATGGARRAPRPA